MLTTSLDKMNEELEKALKDDKHELAAALKEVEESSKALLNASEELRKDNDNLVKELETAAGSAGDLTDALKNIYIVLNADPVNANKIKGVPQIIDGLRNFVMGAGTIKQFVKNESKNESKNDPNN